jgi:hypothetical protein
VRSNNSFFKIILLPYGFTCAIWFANPSSQAAAMYNGMAPMGNAMGGYTGY